MRRVFLALAALLLVDFAAGNARGADVFFRVDPTQSRVRLDPGSQAQLNLPQNFSGFGMGVQILPLVAQPGGGGATLPGGTPSDGLVTSLTGAIRVRLDDPPTQIAFVRDATAIGLQDSGTWLPGLPNVPATAAGGELATTFGNATIAWAWNAVLRETALSFASNPGPDALTPTGAGTWSFAAGCSNGGSCPGFRFEEGAIDFADPTGLLARHGLRRILEPLPNPPGTSGTLVETTSGRFTLTIPIDFTLTLDNIEMHNPVDLDSTLVLSGQIVAVPEAGAGAAALAALAGLAALARRRRARVPSIRWHTLSLAIAAGIFGSGCPPHYDPDIRWTAYSGNPFCSNQSLLVTKDNGAETIGSFTSPTCALGAFSGNLAGIGFEFLTNVQYEQRGDFGVQFHVSSTVNPASAFGTPMEIDERATLRLTYEPAFGAGFKNPQLYYSLATYQYGAAVGEPIDGTLSINGVPASIGATWGEVEYVDLDPTGGSVDLELTLQSRRSNAGKGYQAIGVLGGIRWNVCADNNECRWVDAFAPICTDAGVCGDGRAQAACYNTMQCERPLHCIDHACRPAPGLGLRVDF